MLAKSAGKIGDAVGAIKASRKALSAAKHADNIDEIADIANVGRQARKTAQAPHYPELPVLIEQCFDPDTPVDTPDGPRRIGDIQPGDVVLAFDFEAGQWCQRTVAERHDNVFRGARVTLETESGEVTATSWHPFWVVEGHELDNRPLPKELSEREDQGFALPGRWVNSHDLLAGDLLISRSGRQLRLLGVRQRYEASLPVCNLTIDQHHTFAVGADSILVHNTGGCGKFVAGKKGGRYGDVRAGNKGGQVHHTPASAVSPYTHHTGPSIWMETADHKLTASWGRSKAAQAYRQKQADLIAQGKVRDAVQMDIDDIRSKFGNKYDDHIQEMLETFGDEF